MQVFRRSRYWLPTTLEVDKLENNYRLCGRNAPQTVIPLTAKQLRNHAQDQSDMLNLPIQPLKEFIAQGQSDKALEELINYTSSLPDKHYHNAVIELNARWKANERAHLMGVLAHESYTMERNRINQALLELLDGRLDAANAGVPNKSHTPENARWKKIGYAALIAALISGVADLLGIIHIFSAPKEDSMQLTVMVQGMDGKPIPELQNTGKIIVDFGNDRRAPLIGENGRTNLGEIPMKFRGEKIPLVLQAEGFEPAVSDTQYVMEGKPIYFTAKRDSSLGLVQGIVKDRSGENFIAGALVMIDQETTLTTDNLGRFKIVMPLNKQRDTYTIMVKKDGYKVKNEYYKPKSGAIEIRLDK